MTVKRVDTGEEVTLHWVGFDLVWIKYHDGKSDELVHPSVVGMKPRKRYNYLKRS